MSAAKLPDNFLLSYAGFDQDSRPFIDVRSDHKISRHVILGSHLSIQFNTTIRHCTGWFDFENRIHNPCPDDLPTDNSYDQCLKCRNLTGFNPAFYNADSVSTQQEKINQTPHFIYLAYFSPTLIKVGISQESRGHRRLLEQGARLAIKLETFPSALIARQYEAKVATLDGIVERVTHSQKISALKSYFDEPLATQQLLDVKNKAELSIDVKFNSSEIISTANLFNPANLATETITIIKDQPVLIGHCQAVIGSLAVLSHQGRLLGYDLKSLTGYRGTKADRSATISLPSEQMLLF